MKCRLKNIISITILTSICLFLAGCGKEEDVENKQLTITIEDQEITGSYTGHLISEKPYDNGTFESTDSKWKYEGKWEKGIPDGSGSLWIDGEADVFGTFDRGTVESCEREEYQPKEDSATVGVIFGDVVFMAPEDWTFEYDGATDSGTVKTTDSHVNYYYQGLDVDDMGFGLIGTKEDIKDWVTKQFGKDGAKVEDLEYKVDYSTYTSYNDRPEGVGFRIYNGMKLTDFYAIISKTYDKNKAYWIGVAMTNGVMSHADYLKTLWKTQTTPEGLERIKEEQEAQAKRDQLKEYLQAEDWDNVETYGTEISAYDMINFTQKNKFVKFDGIVDNITADGFDIWLETGETYYKEQYPLTMALPSDVHDGDWVRIYAETYKDGSIDHSGGDLSGIHKLDKEPIPDMDTTFKNSCKYLSFETIMRNPDKYRGVIGKLDGKITQVVETTDSHQKLLVNVDGFGIVEVSYWKEAGADNTLDNDNITAYGIFYQTDTYTTVLGSKNTVPVLVCDYVDIH